MYQEKDKNMTFEFNGGIWKIILLIAGAVITYGAKFISDRLVQEEEKRTKTKITLKVLGFLLVLAAAIAVIFLN